MSATLDASIEHAIYKQRLSAKFARDALPIIKDARDWLRARLAAEGDYTTKRKLRKLIEDSEQQMKRILGRYPRMLSGSLSEYGDYEAEFQQSIVNRLVAGTDLPSHTTVWNSIKDSVVQTGSKQILTYKEMLDGFSGTTARQVRNALIQGFQSGQTLAEVKRSLLGIGGVMNEVQVRHASTLARTGVAHASSIASDEFYKANSDIISHYEWVSVLDTRTTEQCAALSGEVFKVGQGPLPPAHYNCRSTTAPVLVDEFQEVNDLLGSTEGDVTYYQWLKKQKASVIDEALGRERGLIFRNAGLTPQEFKEASVNQFFKPLTIEQMAEKDARIANYVS